MLESLLDYALKEGAAIMHAPVAFAVCVIVAGALIWLFERRHFGERIDTQSATINFLNVQLGEYKSKLSGASPDQAAKELGDLRGEVTSARAEIQMLVGWYQHLTSQRSISIEQGEIIRTTLAEIPEDQRRAVRVACVNEPEPTFYAMQILKVLQDVGMCTGEERPYQMFISTPDEVGLLIVVPDDTNPLPAAAALMDAFKKAGVEANFDRYDSPVGPLCTVMVSYKSPFQAR